MPPEARPGESEEVRGQVWRNVGEGGTGLTKRSPIGQRPKSLVIFVVKPVSSRKTSRSGSIQG